MNLTQTLATRRRIRRRLQAMQAYRPERPSLVHWLTIVFGCMVAAFVLYGSMVLLLAVTRY